MFKLQEPFSYKEFLYAHDMFQTYNHPRSSYHSKRMKDGEYILPDIQRCRYDVKVFNNVFSQVITYLTEIRRQEKYLRKEIQRNGGFSLIAGPCMITPHTDISREERRYGLFVLYSLHTALNKKEKNND